MKSSTLENGFIVITKSVANDSQLDVSTRVKYRCSKVYVLYSNKYNIRTCTGPFTWSGVPPKCKSKSENSITGHIPCSQINYRGRLWKSCSG